MPNDYSKQLASIQEFARIHSGKCGVSVHYNNAYGKYPNLIVDIEEYILDIWYKYYDDNSKDIIRINLYYKPKSDSSRSLPFMIKRDHAFRDFPCFVKSRQDFHYFPVHYSEWADKMISLITTVIKNKGSFLELCKQSCPYNDNGTHKYKFWKNFAELEIKRVDNHELIQGIKGGKYPFGNHIVGGNGSFLSFNKGTYVLQITIRVLSCEKPIRNHKIIIDFDDYLRELMERLGYKKMPYELLNSKLPKQLEVITYDMDKEANNRDFYPIDYNGSWQNLLQVCFKDLQ